MITSFFASKEWFWRAYGRGVLIFVLLYSNVEINVYLIKQAKVIGDLLQHSSGHLIGELYTAILYVVLLRCSFMVCDPAASYFARIYAIDWRRAITHDCIRRWHASPTPIQVEGLSQRLQEEPYKFAQFLENFGAQMLRAIIALASFVPMLQKSSPSYFFTWDGINYEVEGALLYVVWILTCIGIVFGIILGKPLPSIENNNRAVEASFRDCMVLIERGQQVLVVEHLFDHFRKVHVSYAGMYRKFVPADWWTSCYWHSIFAIPLIVTAGWVFEGNITLGTGAQITEAFIACMASSSIFLNNWRAIVDFWATTQRLRGLYAVLPALPKQVTDTAESPVFETDQ